MNLAHHITLVRKDDISKSSDSIWPVTVKHNGALQNIRNMWNWRRQCPMDNVARTTLICARGSCVILRCASPRVNYCWCSWPPSIVDFYTHRYLYMMDGKGQTDRLTFLWLYLGGIVVIKYDIILNCHGFLEYFIYDWYFM